MYYNVSAFCFNGVQGIRSKAYHCLYFCFCCCLLLFVVVVIIIIIIIIVVFVVIIIIIIINIITNSNVIILSQGRKSLFEVGGAILMKGGYFVILWRVLCSI